MFQLLPFFVFYFVFQQIYCNNEHNESIRCETFKTCYDCMYFSDNCIWLNLICQQRNNLVNKNNKWYERYTFCSTDLNFQKNISNLCLTEFINEKKVKFYLNSNSMNGKGHFCKWDYSKESNDSQINIAFKKSNEIINSNALFFLQLTFADNKIAKMNLESKTFNMSYHSINEVSLQYLNKEHNKHPFEFTISLLSNETNSKSQEQERQKKRKILIASFLVLFLIVCFIVVTIICCVNKKIRKEIPNNNSTVKKVNNNETNTIKLPMENASSTKEDNPEVEVIEVRNNQRLKREAKSLTIYDQKCTACLEYLNLNEEFFKNTCGHFYHTNCINDYVNKGNSRCPKCEMRIKIPKNKNEIKNESIVNLRSSRKFIKIKTKTEKA